MKKADRSLMTNKNFDLLISKMSADAILTLEAMSCVRGGEGEANGGEPVILPPKKQP
jgi:hypothetical protein